MNIPSSPDFNKPSFNQVDDRAEQYMGNPQALQDMYQQKQQLIDLLALQKIKSQKEAAAREMQLQMAQKSGQPQTTRQRLEQQVLDMTKQEMVQQQAGNLGQKQQEQQQNLQQVLKGMSQGAPQPPQQGTPGVPQQSAPGVASLQAPGLMPPKAMASGGIVAFDEGGAIEEWEEEWKRRNAELGDPNRAQTWIERNIVDRKQQAYDQSKRRAASELSKQYKPGINTPTTKAERMAYEAKEAIIKNMAEGKYDPTGKPLVPTVGGKPVGAQPAAMAAAAKQEAAPVANPLEKIINKNKLTPQAPKAAPAAPAAPALAPQAPAGGLQGIMEAAATKQVTRDPVAEAKAKREEATAALGYTPDERTKFEANQKAIEDFDAAQFDPDKMKSDRLTDFLLGAAGRSTLGSTLSGAGRSAENAKRQQLAMQRAAMGERQTKQEGLLELGRKAREKGFEIGEKSAEQAEMGTRQGLASGTAMVDADKQMETAGLDRASREYVARLHAQVQREATAASKEGTLALKQQTLLANIDKAEETAVSTAKKSAPAYAIIKNIGAIESTGAKLDKTQVAQKQSAEADMDKIEMAIRNKFQDTRAMVMSGNSGAGLGSLSTGGWKVTPVTPAKK